MISRKELRTGFCFGLGLTGIFALYVVPLIFSDAVNVTVSSDITGEVREYIAPGMELIPQLLAFLAFAFLLGIPIGVISRRSRQLALLGAANPAAPDHLRGRYKLNFIDRVVHRMQLDGTDA
ncbi:hypothetical protein [Shimia thalassica]|jgi:hypothetical protein|uniref:hypothetical protein n=1 Tax=Shimia thalassica TaxID=1715693 RepID=UPI0026E39992|nr:hypothetical protein [Shimia thalassica]MDO6484407.1 hypothetical protein [Shimia thalassica]